MTFIAPLQQDQPDATADGLAIDFAERKVLWKGQFLPLAGRSFELLAALAAKPGRHVSAENLTRRVWRGRVVEAHNLRMQINRLRQLLGAQAISNQPGRGYRLELPVRGGAKLSAPGLIGRDNELAQLAAKTRTHPLLTVTGAGGIGKTSLVRAWFNELEVDANLAAAWVDLTGALAPRLPTLMAAALGLNDILRAWTPRALAASLPLQNTWLIVDHGDHLAEAVTAIALALLDAAPQLHIVVVNQIPLHLAQEQVLHLGPLKVPEAKATLDQALQCAAIQLLVARVRAFEPSYVLDEAQRCDAITLCRSLDGLPLAIELAAARIPVQGLRQLVESLDQRLLLLHGPTQGRPQRQQTLSAALEWTHALLPRMAQTAFARLGVFTGAFPLQAAVAVAADEPGCGPLDRMALIDALQALVDASMVTRTEGEAEFQVDIGTPCFRLLESPRLLALQCLHQTDQEEGTRQRHLAWCLGSAKHAPVATLAGTALGSRGQCLGPSEVRELDRAVQQRGQVSRLVRSARVRERPLADEALQDFVSKVLVDVAAILRLGRFDEGRDLIDQALAELESREARRRAVHHESMRRLLDTREQQDLLRQAAAQRNGRRPPASSPVP